MNGAVARQYRVDHRANLRFVGEIAREHQDRVPMGSLDGRRSSGQTSRITRAKRQQGAFPGQRMRRCQAYALAARSDQCHLALETEIHAGNLPRP